MEENQPLKTGRLSKEIREKMLDELRKISPFSRTYLQADEVSYYLDLPYNDTRPYLVVYINDEDGQLGQLLINERTRILLARAFFDASGFLLKDVVFLHKTP